MSQLFNSYEFLATENLNEIFYRLLNPINLPYVLTFTLGMMVLPFFYIEIERNFLCFFLHILNLLLPTHSILD